MKEKLLKLIQENPNLEIIPLVNYNTINYMDEDSTYTACEFSNPFIDEYCYFDFYGRKEFVLLQDVILIEDYLYKTFSYDKNLIQIELDKLEWKKAIFVYINQRKEGLS